AREGTLPVTPRPSRRTPHFPAPWAPPPLWPPARPPPLTSHGPSPPPFAHLPPLMSFLPSQDASMPWARMLSPLRSMRHTPSIGLPSRVPLHSNSFGLTSDILPIMVTTSGIVGPLI